MTKVSFSMSNTSINAKSYHAKIPVVLWCILKCFQLSVSMKQNGIATEHANKFSNLNKSYTIYHYSFPLWTLLILFLHNRRVVITIRCCIIDYLGKCFKWLLVWKTKWQVYTVRMRGTLLCRRIVSFEGNPFKRRWASTLGSRQDRCTRLRCPRLYCPPAC